jgi:hypothetical protein
MEHSSPDEPLEALDWVQWQARKRASYEADQRALLSGEKTREQLVEETVPSRCTSRRLHSRGTISSGRAARLRPVSAGGLRGPA